MIELIEDLGMKYISGQRRRIGMYICTECGEEKERRVDAHKGCSSCSVKTHGFFGTRLYTIWAKMKDRCNNPNNNKYQYYGKKSITVGNEWLDFIPFKEWAFLNGYESHLTIDRIDSSGNYEPSNCRWADYYTQNANKGTPKNNTSGYKGVKPPFGKQKSFTVIINVNKKRIYVGSAKGAKDAAILYNNYIDKHNLPHTKNTIGEENE